MDAEFQAKYKVEFFAQGCVRVEVDDEGAYNKAIFKELDKIYDPEWREELRTDAVSFKVSN